MQRQRSAVGFLCACIVGALAIGSLPVGAQVDVDHYVVQPDGSAPGINQNPAAPPAAQAPGQPSSPSVGPVRLARVSYMTGNVTWRPSETEAWSPAALNLPMREGAQVWATDDARVEIQFDDGSALRIGHGAIATFQTLYSDGDGEFTEIKLTNGIASLHLRHDHSIYQIDAPILSIKADGPAQLRVGVGDGAEVAVRSGSAAVEGSQGKVSLEAGQYVDALNADTPLNVRGIPQPDSWTTWSDERDTVLYGDSVSQRYLPPSVGQVAGDLDDYGAWHHDPKYGEVWAPNNTPAGWRPYYYGHWVMCQPFGWTWVGDEPWGWAPYHYGSWIDEPYGWSWCPGPAYQYWSPAVVDYCDYNGGCAWVPLAPCEVVYPTTFAIGLGFCGPRWGSWFSIGAVGCWGPGSTGGLFLSFAFNTGYCNRWRWAPGWDRGFGPGELASRSPGSVPYNARFAAGASFASYAAFGGRGAYEPLQRGQVAAFREGQTAAFAVGRQPFAGPMGVRPAQLSYTPTRSIAGGVAQHPAALDRAVMRAPLPATIARGAAPINNAREPGALNTVRTNGQGNSAYNARQGSTARTGVTGPGQAAEARTGVGQERSMRTSSVPDAVSRARADLGIGGGSHQAGASDTRSGADSARADVRGSGSSERTDASQSPARSTGGSVPDMVSRARQDVGYSRSYGSSGAAGQRGYTSGTAGGSRGYSSGGSGSYHYTPHTSGGSGHSGGGSGHSDNGNSGQSGHH